MRTDGFRVMGSEVKCLYRENWFKLRSPCPEQQVLLGSQMNSLP